MSELTTLARPYASAAYKRAKESAATAQWSDMLSFLSGLMQDEALVRLIDNPKISQDKLCDLLMDISGDHLNHEGQAFLRTLLQNRRIKLAKYIHELYECYKAEDEGYVDVVVTTAYPVDEDESNNLAAVLQQQLGKKVNLQVVLDQTLIGGVLIRAGDKVIDASIRGQLQRMAKRIYS